MWGNGYPFNAPYVSRKVTYQREMYPQAEAYWQRTVVLPVLHSKINPELLEEIVEAVAKVI